MRSGGRQHKVAVGDVLEVDRLTCGRFQSSLTRVSRWRCRHLNSSVLGSHGDREVLVRQVPAASE